MSINAISWAMDQDIFPSTAKFVLVCLCDNVGMDEVVFPSLETLCRKTSQDRKTVIACLDRLCEIGLLSEEGTKRGGVKKYRILGLPTGVTHYVYQLTHIQTDEFYIGVRSCTGNICFDDYFGSGRWPQEIGKELLSKKIIGIYSTRKEAELAEAFLINSHKDSDKLKNRFLPRSWQVPKTEPVPNTVLVPKTEPHQYQERNMGSTENGTPPVPRTEHRIINESSIEPSHKPVGNRGTRLPDDWILPKAWGEWALKERPELNPDDVRKIAEGFKDYWIALPGQRAAKTDWFATWRNRVRDVKLDKPKTAQPASHISHVARKEEPVTPKASKAETQAGLKKLREARKQLLGGPSVDGLA